MSGACRRGVVGLQGAMRAHAGPVHGVAPAGWRCTVLRRTGARTGGGVAQLTSQNAVLMAE